MIFCPVLLVGIISLLNFLQKTPVSVPASEFPDKKIPDCRYVQFTAMLKGMDAYIATGSNNSARYFEYYFGKFPSLIRRNRTSIALLQGDETAEELEKLADDVFSTSVWVAVM